MTTTGTKPASNLTHFTLGLVAVATAVAVTMLPAPSFGQGQGPGQGLVPPPDAAKGGGKGRGGGRGKARPPSRPTPHWPDGRVNLGPIPGEKGVWEGNAGATLATNLGGGLDNPVDVPSDESQDQRGSVPALGAGDLRLPPGHHHERRSPRPLQTLRWAEDVSYTLWI